MNKTLTVLMNSLVLSCQKATELMEKEALVGLSWREKMQRRMHTSMCSACRAYETQCAQVDQWLRGHIHANREDALPVVENENLKARIISNL